MQNVKMKKCFCVLLVVFMVIVSFSFGQLSVSAETQQGSLGSQQPAIEAAYTDAEGIICDGNALAPGSYTMTLSVSDLYSIADIQFTANYDETVLSFSLIGEKLLSDTLPHMDGFVMSRTGGTFTFFLTSINSDMTILPENSADLISIGITVKGDKPVDMQDVLAVNEDPDFTYISVNYGDCVDNVYNCYALSDSETFQGTVYPMTCDLSPNGNQLYMVSAYVGVLASPDDIYGSFATTGAVVKITTDDGKEISAVTDENGKFILNDVPNGTYTATIMYDYGFDREFTIIVDGSDVISETMIGIVGCDWNNDGSINTSDYAIYNGSYLANSVDDNYKVEIDLTRDGSINTSDYGIYFSFYFESEDSFEYSGNIVIS